MFKIILKDKRIWLLVLLVALVVGVSRWVVPDSWISRTVAASGYWFTFLLVTMFVRALWPAIKERVGKMDWLPFDGWVAAGVLAVVGVWVSHERPGYKILADELLLSGTAMHMHYDREASYPIRGTNVQGPFALLGGQVDKRPLLFPFLLSSVHDLTGYRTANAFYINIVLAPVFLWIIYLLGWKVGGSRWAGVVMMLLFAGLPLMAQQATGGGFELLNLLLLAAVTLLMAYYLEKPESGRLEAMVFGGLLLASTRYESAVFLAAVAIAAFVGWWRKGVVVLSWPLLLSPFFLAVPLIQNRIFELNPQMWQLGDIEGATEPFGINYISKNVGHALVYFFDMDGGLSNSPFFAAVGLICIPFFGLLIFKSIRSGRKISSDNMAWMVAGAGLSALTALYMLYFWGTFDTPIISRLSLPVHLLMALAAIGVGASLFKTSKGWRVAAGVVLISVFCHGIPTIAKQAYRMNYNPGVEMQMRADFLNSLTDQKILFIDNDNIFWLLHKVSSSPVKTSMQRKESLAFLLKNHGFRDMYVFQSVLVNDVTGAKSVDPADDLGPDFGLETVWEERVRTLLFARISRITSITDDSGKTVQSPVFVDAIEMKRSAAELEKARGEYMQKWISQLP